MKLLFRKTAGMTISAMTGAMMGASKKTEAIPARKSRFAAMGATRG